jgi:hypothetical protein
MNENAKRWVEALRSGKYPQTRRTLKDDAGFCCLGVACDLYAEEVEGANWKLRGEGAQAFHGVRSIGYSVPPPEVIEWLGLRSEIGHVNDVDPSLTMLNDGSAQADSGMDVRRHSFVEIADWIASEPEGLFVEEVDLIGEEME